MSERVSFNINAELYEDQFGDLAVRLPGNRVYRDVGAGAEADFVRDATAAVVDKRVPTGWHEMPPHELLYGKGWHCVSRMGFVNGEVDRPGVEFDLPTEQLGVKAQAYLGEVLRDHPAH